MYSLWCISYFTSYTFFCLLQECYLENDQTSLYHTAKGLMTLQALYGTIPQIYGKGECARVSMVLAILCEKQMLIAHGHRFSSSQMISFV